MPKVETNRADILKKLLADGWVLACTGGEHDIYKHPASKKVIVLPRHRTLSPGVARSLAKIAGWL